MIEREREQRIKDLKITAPIDDKRFVREPKEKREEKANTERKITFLQSEALKLTVQKNIQ